MSTPTNAVTLSVLLLLSHLFLLSHSLHDSSATVAVSASAIESGSKPEPSDAADSKDEPHQTVVFHPSESDGPVDPDLIAHSFRLPDHRHQHPPHRHFHHGLGCGGGGHRRPIGDGPIRLPSMQQGFGVGRGPFVEVAAEDFEQMKRDKKEKKWMKKERKDDEDSDSDSDDDDEEFEHEKKRMKRPRREGNWGFMGRVRHFLNHF